MKKFCHVSRDDKVNVEKYRPVRGDNVVFSSFCNIAPAKRARLARSCKQARARSAVSHVRQFRLLNKVDKRQDALRPVKFPAIVKMVTEYILQG